MNQNDRNERLESGRSLMPRLTVIIVNYESWPDVLELTAALAEEPEFSSGRCGIVVVDNASRGPLPEAFSLHRVGQRVVFRPDNGGFAAGVNAGWRVAAKSLAFGTQSRCGSGEWIPGPGLRATRSIRNQGGRSAGDRRVRLAKPRRLTAGLGRRLPQPAPNHSGAVHTPFSQEIPARLANSLRARSTGSRVRACW